MGAAESECTPHNPAHSAGTSPGTMASRGWRMGNMNVYFVSKRKKAALSGTLKRNSTSPAGFTVVCGPVKGSAT